MRQILVERARARGAVKRGGAWARMTLNEGTAAAPEAGGRRRGARPGAGAARRARSGSGAARRAALLRRPDDRGDGRRARRLAGHRQAIVDGGARVAEEGAGRGVTREQWARVNALFHEGAGASARRARRVAGPRDLRPRHRARGAGADRRARERRRLPRGAGGRVRRDRRRRRPPRPRWSAASSVPTKSSARSAAAAWASSTSPATRGSAAPVALKAVSRGGADAVGRARLQREARAAASLAHPGIATVYALEEDGDDCYLITEYLQGRTLRDELDRRAAAVRPLAAGGDRHRRGRRRRARAGPRPSRSQARERDAHRRRRDQGARLRPGARDDAARAPA